MKGLYYSSNTVWLKGNRSKGANSGAKPQHNKVISFNSFKTEGNSPIYLQILDFIKRGAAAGTIVDGEELPSRRVLSALLGINPNTVQKAFRLLEEDGLIESRAGSGSVMKLDPETVSRLKTEILSEDVRSITSALKRTGVSREEALRLIAQYWDEPAEGREADHEEA